MNSSDCQSCVNMNCLTEWSACIADPGTPSGGECMNCAAYATDTTGTVEIKDLCGWDDNGGTCEADSSCAMAQAVDVCLCGSSAGSG
jgi:hypothetical protein